MKHSLSHPMLAVRDRTKFAVIAVLSVTLFLCFYFYFRPVPLAQAPAQWSVISCDVGQGDMTLIRITEQAAIAVDAGPDSASATACLKWAGIAEVPLVFITHAHADHDGGLPAVCRSCTVLTSGHSQKEIQKKFSSADFRVAHVGTVLKPNGRISLEVLSAPGANSNQPGQGDSEQENNSSLVLSLKVIPRENDSSFTMLLTGDIEDAQVNKLLKSLPSERVDVLKVPHHGSKHSGTALEEKLHPTVGIISAGKDNSYGHPHAEIVEALEKSRTEIMRTSERGHIAFYLSEDGKSVQISSEKS